MNGRSLSSASSPRLIESDTRPVIVSPRMDASVRSNITCRSPITRAVSSMTTQSSPAISPSDPVSGL